MIAQPYYSRLLLGLLGHDIFFDTAFTSNSQSLILSQSILEETIVTLNFSTLHTSFIRNASLKRGIFYKKVMRGFQFP